MSLTQRSAAPSALLDAPESPGLRYTWVDRVLGSDPGLTRLLGALQAVLTIAVILGVEYWFVHATHALQIQTHGAKLSAAQAIQTAAVNHGTLVIGMLLGAIVGMISTFGVMDPTAKGQLTTMLLLPFPMVAALTFGIAIGGHRIVALSSLAVLLAIGTYLRRFGPRGFIAGLLLFMGDFFGFFLYGTVKVGDLGWLVAEIGVGLLTAMVVRFVLFFPRPAKALGRSQRSYAARARKVSAVALELFDNPQHTARDVHRLQRQLVRLNENALIIDAQLGEPAAVADGSSAQRMHQRLFDVELALTNIGRFAPLLGRLDLPADQRRAARGALVGIVQRDPQAAREHAETLLRLTRHGAPTPEDRAAVVIPHRYAGSVLALTEAWVEWVALGASDGSGAVFEPSVTLFGGWLPGSSLVSATASQESGDRRGDRIRLAPYTRTAIQMGIAVGAAIALGDLLSGRRFYWAVIAAFITFMGANNSGEQIRKALFRVAGTVIGIGIGSLLVHLVGAHTDWSLAVIMVSLFLGFYLMRINYAFMVVGITVMVSQLYVQLDEFTNSLLVLRLEETALGAAVAIAVVLLVLPLRTRRVLGVALRDHVETVDTLVVSAGAHLTGESVGASTLRADARAVDASYQAVVATTQPLRRNLFGDVEQDTGQLMRLASALRNYSRNLVSDVRTSGPLDVETHMDVERAVATLHTSLQTVMAAFTGPRDGIYVRSAALFDRAERRVDEDQGGVHPTALAMRDFKFVDGTSAKIAELMGLHVAEFDTARAR